VAFFCLSFSVSVYEGFRTLDSHFLIYGLFYVNKNLAHLEFVCWGNPELVWCNGFFSNNPYRNRFSGPVTVFLVRPGSDVDP